MNTTLKTYIGKEVRTLFEVPEISNFSKYIFFDEPPGFLSHLSLKYKNDVYLDIYVSKYRYTKRFDSARGWRLSTFKKEKISKINIVYNEKIIKSIN